ncbi:hypothetical protein A2U01_0060091, partial [Trifolium medium]|nr:hypothetical protein [Trifolium medium]
MQPMRVTAVEYQRLRRAQGLAARG